MLDSAKDSLTRAGARALPEGEVRLHEPSKFSINIRIYYEDTDVAGVVYYANYLRYLNGCVRPDSSSITFKLS
jgi:hypothetical protein